MFVKWSQRANATIERASVGGGRGVDEDFFHEVSLD
jgi:hypothetical protein